MFNKFARVSDTKKTTFVRLLKRLSFLSFGVDVYQKRDLKVVPKVLLFTIYSWAYKLKNLISKKTQDVCLKK